MKELIKISLALIVVSGAMSGFTKTGTTAATFLKIECGARAVSMGGAFTALGNDPVGAYYNPSGIAELDRIYFTGGHTVWFAGLSYNHAALVIPSTRMNFCLWSAFLSSDAIEITTIEDPEGTGQNFNYFDGLFAFSVSAFLSDRLSVGITGKYIQQSLYNESASTFALDIGSILRTPLKGLRLGMCLSNYGGRMQLAGNDLVVQTDPWPEYEGNSDVEARLTTESYPLPLAFKMGIAVDILGRTPAIWPLENTSLTVAIDGIHPNDSEEKMQAGIEYGMYDILFLRAGYKLNYDTQKYTVGAGIKTRIVNREISVDYAYVDMQVLDSTHRITVSLGF